MFSIQALLANKLTEYLPLIGMIAGGVIALFVFVYGFCRGYRRISRGNIYKLLAGLLFVALYGGLYKANLIDKIFKMNAILADGVWAVVLALLCALVVLLIYGGINALFKPNTEYQHEFITLEDGIEYDDHLPEEKLARQRKVRHMGYQPSFLGRLSGGLICLINFAVGLAMLAAFLLVVINGTKLATGSLHSIYEVNFLQKIMKYLTAYTFDVVCVGIIFGFGYLGYKNGFVGTLWNIMKGIGLIAIIVLCIAAPFIDKIAAIKLMSKLISKMTAWLEGSLSGNAAVIGGKIVTGVVLALVAGIVMFVVNLLLRSIADAIDNVPFFTAIDGAVAAIVYACFGVVICALLWTLVYCMDYCGYLNISKLWGEKPAMLKEAYQVIDKYLVKYADKYLARFKK